MYQPAVFDDQRQRNIGLCVLGGQLRSKHLLIKPYDPRLTWMQRTYMCMKQYKLIYPTQCKKPRENYERPQHELEGYGLC
jgi:hypothetical protein